MNNNQYNEINNFKQEIKNEVNAQAFGLLTVFGLFSFAVIFLSLFIYIFSKDSHFSDGIKAVSSIVLVVFGIVFICSEKVKNAVLRGWVALLLILFIIFCLACGGLIFYVAYVEIKKA